jgi:TPR repeat protein
MTTVWKESPFTKILKTLRKQEKWKDIQILCESRETYFHSIYLAEAFIKQNQEELGKLILIELINNMESNTADELFILGKCHRLLNQNEKSFNLYLKAAEAGSGDAQHNLSIYYKLGTVVPKNMEKSLYWLSKAAENNLIDSQFNMAIYYEIGMTGMERNLEKSFYWFNRASENGDFEAKLSVAEFFENGISVNQDLVEAYSMYCALVDCEDVKISELAKKKVETFQKEEKTLQAYYDKTKMYKRLNLIHHQDILKFYDVVISISK